MKNKIDEFNNLYKQALERAEKIRHNLGRHCVDHALVFFNNHHIRIDNKPECVEYPIPSIICKLSSIQTKIGFDIATDKDYIGFIKFTFNKEQFLTFNFEAIKTFKFEVYGDLFCKEIVNLKGLKEVKTNVMNPRENFAYIKIKISVIEQIITIINNLSDIPQKKFSMLSYVCDCGNQITVESDNGECPICGKDSPHKKIIKAKCPVCAQTTLLDKFGHGECENCGWLIDKMSEKYRSRVIYPNLIPLNKAKKLYIEGKPFKPDLNDFLEMLCFYSEVEFWYKGLNCCVFLTSNPKGKIEFGWSPENGYYFSDKEDFIQNAKIGDEFVRDIWDKVENPKYI